MNIMSNFLFIAELSSGKGFGFNPNFLEANVINIAILLYGVVYFGRNFFASALEVRQREVVEIIQESEERLQQSRMKLTEAEERLAGAQSEIDQIKKEAEAMAKRAKVTIKAQGRLEVNRVTENGRLTMIRIEAQMKKSVQQYISGLAIQRANTELKEYLTLELQSNLLSKRISQLGDQL